jgi:hypothetical protein
LLGKRPLGRLHVRAEDFTPQMAATCASKPAEKIIDPFCDARLKALAKRRLADEYDAAQERGEVAGHGGARNFKVRDDNLERPTIPDIGLTKEQIHEARQIRDAEKAARAA